MIDHMDGNAEKAGSRWGTGVRDKHSRMVPDVTKIKRCEKFLFGKVALLTDTSIFKFTVGEMHRRVP